MLSSPRYQQHPRPIAIGAVGGSGTRVIAQFLRSAGYFMGSDLNDASDNLWFTLLFKRRDILLESREGFIRAAQLFFERMRGSLGEPSASTVQYVRALATKARPQHSAEWLTERANTFLGGVSPDAEVNTLWGWKEPNTHIVIGELLQLNPELRYIHLVRNGLDMAFSQNQNQLEFWGSIFLGFDAEPTPHRALAYWCAVDRRINETAKLFPDRIMVVDFDKFCANPREGCRSILDFCNLSFSEQMVTEFTQTVIRPATVGRFRDKGIADLDPIDLAYVRSRGYAIE